MVILHDFTESVLQIPFPVAHLKNEKKLVLHWYLEYRIEEVIDFTMLQYFALEAYERQAFLHDLTGIILPNSTGNILHNV